MFRSFFSPLKKSMTSFEFYPLVLSWPIKRRIMYFLSLSGLLAFVALWIQLPSLILGVTELTDWAVRKLPMLKIQEGKLEIAGSQKYYQFDLSEEFSFLGKTFYFTIHDLDGKDEPSIDKKPGQPSKKVLSGIHLKEDKIEFREGEGIKTFPYPKGLSMTVSSFTLMNWRDIFIWTLPLYLGARIFFNLLIFKGMEILIIGSLGYFWIKSSRRIFSWKSCVSLSVFAITPALFFAFITSITVPFIPYLDFAYYGIFGLYFVKGLKLSIEQGYV